MPPPGIAPGLPAPQAGVLLLYYSGEVIVGFRYLDAEAPPTGDVRVVRNCYRHLGRVVKAID